MSPFPKVQSFKDLFLISKATLIMEHISPEITYSMMFPNRVPFFSQFWKANNVLFKHDSSISQAINLRRCSKCLAKTSSGQYKSLIKVCRADSFQKSSSDVVQPTGLKEKKKTCWAQENEILKTMMKLAFTLWGPIFLFQSLCEGFEQ